MGLPSSPMEETMQTLTGVLEFRDIGVGSWLLRAGDKLYELIDFDLDGAASGSEITIRGQEVQEQLMGISMSASKLFRVSNN
jgi:hypothetical protein